MGGGRCLGPEGNRVSLVEGMREGPAPQEAREINSQCSTRAETTWRRTRRNGKVGCDEEGSARTECATSLQDKDYVIYVKHVHYWVELTFCLFQENKSYCVKTTCIDPLSIRCCTSR
jgi:hypothetical protein